MLNVKCLSGCAFTSYTYQRDGGSMLAHQRRHEIQRQCHGKPCRLSSVGDAGTVNRIGSRVAAVATVAPGWRGPLPRGSAWEVAR